MDKKVDKSKNRPPALKQKELPITLKVQAFGKKEGLSAVNNNRQFKAAP